MKRRYEPCPIFDLQSPSRWLRPTSVRECRFLKEETLEQFALYPMPRYCWTLVMNIMTSDIGCHLGTARYPDSDHCSATGSQARISENLVLEFLPPLTWNTLQSFKIVPILLSPHSDVRLRARICWCNIVRLVQKPKNFNIGTKCWHLGEGRRPASRQPRSTLE